MPQCVPIPGDLAEALSRVSLGRLGTTVRYFSSIGSTNDAAMSLAADGHLEGAVVIAETQTSGRGRLGRVWFSPPGAGLYVSVILAPRLARLDPDRATALLTLAAAVALAESIQRVTGLAPAIKWPNDLLVGRRKLAGILAEGVSSSATAFPQSVVLGFGINVSTAAYPLELSARVTSIESELGRAVDRAQLCAEALAALSSRYEDLLDARFDAILGAWRSRAPAVRGARVSWVAADGPVSGTTIDIDERGALLVAARNRIERIVGGEVLWE
jgi:BirA family biotin operon repressor/biotin-[acetyl-CoA-carboxylase] ligase